MYPELEINLDGILHNALCMKKICEEQGIHLSVVTKGLVSDHRIVKLLADSGIAAVCESRIQNFIDYQDIDVEKWLIREPMLCEIESVVRYADVSLNSELKTLQAINLEAEKQNKVHKVILMYELGDLREGCDEEELCFLAQKCLDMKHIHLYGIGANLSCYGSILPDSNNMKELAGVAERLEEKLGIKLEIVTGGNSTSFEMLKDGLLPKKINSLRMGESVLFANVPCYEKPIDGFVKKNFVLNAQIIEIKEKPSVPRGTMAQTNTFGGEPLVFEDRGIRKRAIVGIGKQDIAISGLAPRDENMIILDGSSDYVLLDITDCEKDYEIGDIVSFDVNYLVMLGAMHSKYVHRTYK